MHTRRMCTHILSQYSLYFITHVFTCLVRIACKWFSIVKQCLIIDKASADKLITIFSEKIFVKFNGIDQIEMWKEYMSVETPIEIRCERAKVSADRIRADYDAFFIKRWSNHHKVNFIYLFSYIRRYANVFKQHTHLWNRFVSTLYE